MLDPSLQSAIEAMWDRRDQLSAPPRGALTATPSNRRWTRWTGGEARVAEPGPDGRVVNQWLKKAVLLSFRISDSQPMAGAAGAPVFDKVAMKTEGWGQNRFADAGFRAVPGAIVRRSAYVAPGVVLMPSFVNVGAYVGAARWWTPGPRSEAARRWARTAT